MLSDRSFGRARNVEGKVRPGRRPSGESVELTPSPSVVVPLSPPHRPRDLLSRSRFYTLSLLDGGQTFDSLLVVFSNAHRPERHKSGSSGPRVRHDQCSSSPELVVPLLTSPTASSSLTNDDVPAVI